MRKASEHLSGAADFDCAACGCDLNVPQDLLEEEHFDLQCINCGAELYVERVEYFTATVQ